MSARDDMGTNDRPENSEQLKIYAEDLAQIYKQEKEKRTKLEFANRQLREYAGALNTTVNRLKRANEELSEAYLDTIHRLAMAAEFKDEDTGLHIIRISRYSALLAAKLGLSAHEIDVIFSASPMHDIGKISIPDSILTKPDSLTIMEFEIIKTHTTFGARILSNSKSEVIRVAEQIALSHHEKWNGTGYPLGLAGTDTPLVGRIVGIVDVFDALTTVRPYKDPYPIEIAMKMIQKERGEHFDPDLVDVFLENFETIQQIQKEVSHPEETTVKEFRWSKRDINQSLRG